MIEPSRAGPPGPSGTVTILQHDSQVLRGNPWQDPHQRPLPVYQTPGLQADDGPAPTLWNLAAYTNTGPGHLNWRNHGENLPQRLDRLFYQQRIGPMRVVFPDCYTSLGGNQYLNSSAVGAYEDYLLLELLPFMEQRFNTQQQPAGRGVFGKSSGGYGALMQGMRHADIWGGVAAHAADMYFELVFKPDFPTLCAVLSQYQGDALGFIQAFWRKNKPSGREFHALMLLGMAASYDPDPEQPWGFQLPVDLHTCELRQQRWQRWLQSDPVHLLSECADNLKTLRGLYLDVGLYDQYNLQYGNRILHRELNALGVPHEYEEFDGNHSAMDFRLDQSIPFLYAALQQ